MASNFQETLLNGVLDLLEPLEQAATDAGPYAIKADQPAALPQDVRATLQIVPVHELAAA